MVCHETYKDKNNNWLRPDEVEKIGNNCVLKNQPKKLLLVHQSYVKIKNVIDPEYIIENYGADSQIVYFI